MLNKNKKRLVEMASTLKEAVNYLISVNFSSEAMSIDDVYLFIDSMNNLLKDEYVAIAEKGERFKLQISNIASNLQSDIDELLALLEDYAQLIEEIKPQYKVVFLPYYENTWDSLESVYKAFRNDPNFVTEIVIIPIFRNNINGGVSMVYEDYLSPISIPNTNWEQYSFENDLPDIVFVNNPYDGVNHPKFQAHNIKQFTDQLVYIPYAFLFDDRMDRAPHLKEKEQLHISTELSVHQLCDLYIAQNQDFVDRFGKAANMENKMVALGNPKADRLFEAKTEGFVRNPVWEEKIQNKKVIFLNTHTQDFLSDNVESYFSAISNMEALLHFVEENEKEFALIWRPHPNTLIVRNNLENWVTKYFDATRTRLENSSNMVYDDTGSSNSAMMYSDVVISSPSSMVVEALCLDKPVYLIVNTSSFYLNSESKELGAIFSTNYSEVVENVEETIDHTNPLPRHALVYSKASEYVIPFKNVPKEIVYHILGYENYSKPLTKFLNEIKQGVDSKKDIRETLRKKYFCNIDGSCGKAVYEYIKNNLK